MYKLVAIDLDGTLLNSKKRISEKNKGAIKKAIEAGVQVVVCSGRIYTGAKIFGKEIGTKLPLITCNGARIKDMNTNEVLFCKTLDVDVCKQVVDICKKEDVYFHTYIEDTMFTEKLEYSSLFYWERNKELPIKDRIDIQLIPCMKEVLGKHPNDISKLVIISNDLEKLAKVRKIVEQVQGVLAMSSNFDNFEVMNSEVSKGAALKFLAEKYGIKREEVIAIGDNENDLSMLEYAGLPISMANAEAYVKEVSLYVTLSNNEDGVAHAIEKFVL